MKRVCFILTVILTLLLAVSCSKGDGTAHTGDENGGTGGQNGEFTVTFDSAGGTPLPSLKVASGSLIEWPTPPEKKGYLFLGWYCDGRLWSFKNDKVVSDMTLTAEYMVVDYTINYETNGGYYSGTLQGAYNVEGPIKYFPALKKSGYSFGGWFLDGKKVESTEGLYGNLVLKAVFYNDVPEILHIENESPTEIYAFSTSGKNSITVSTISEESNRAVALRVSLPDNWYYVKVTTQGTAKYFKTTEHNDMNTIDINVKTGDKNTVITPVALSNDLALKSDYGIKLSSGTIVDKNYFPGFVRKAVTFTLDDGLYQFDKKVVDILKPAGFSGTFNINNPATVTDPSIYDGFEIANHNILHAVAMKDAYASLEFVNEYLPKDADTSKVYMKSQTVDGEIVEGLYYVCIGGSWHPLASDETYAKYLEWTTVELEKIFGEGSVVGFAYPHGNQYNDAVINYLKENGYLYGRRTGNLKATTGFALPEDRYTWTYNADHNCLLDVMADFDGYRDDGELKMFSFGVHAKDFETKEKWDDLRTFASLYGNRQKDFFYATNREIFEYEDAVKALVITDEAITNPSDVDVFVTIDGVKTIIFANSEYSFK